MPHDIACAVLIGVLEYPGLTVTSEAITLANTTAGSAIIERNWLRVDDILGQVAWQCYQAKQQMSNVQIHSRATPWEKARAIRTRDEAAANFRHTRGRALEILKTRGVLADGERRGMRVLADS